ncbi:hypothetical protein CPB84DRAFT_1850208 [Gymnopilus junonius]|uniref:C2H2-type domain-containing protein n=1 Tax=Gymnopilus junonius TaxID=109634 RepID=A0A9P5NGD4_GYMJU|nr:hypothetical protein CPB84DRAFT_1850208 [Gymnopilus junonius]
MNTLSICIKGFNASVLATKTQKDDCLVWETLPSFGQDTRDFISGSTFSSMGLEPGTLDFVAPPQKSHVPRISIWSEYPRYLLDDYDETESEDSASSSSSRSSIRRPTLPTYAKLKKADGPLTPNTCPSDSEDASDYSSDEGEEDDDYSPPPPPARRAFSLKPTQNSSASTSRTRRIGGRVQSVPSTPKRKFKELEEQSDKVGGHQKASTSDKKPKVIQCPKCPHFRARAKGDMKRHLESLAHQPQSYYCSKPGCGKVFTRIDALKRHIQTTPGHY